MTFCRIFAAWARFSRWDLSIQAVHCKETIPTIRNKYSQKRNCAATVPIPKFMFLWAIYIFPWSVCLFYCLTIGMDRTWEYIDRSHRHMLVDRGRAIPFLGKHKSKFLCSVVEILTGPSVPPLGFVFNTCALTLDRGRFQRWLGLSPPPPPLLVCRSGGERNLAAAIH